MIKCGYFVIELLLCINFTVIKHYNESKRVANTKYHLTMLYIHILATAGLLL